MKLYLNKIKKNKEIKELLEFGIINVDKPSGPTSFKTDEIIKKELGLKKAAHTGTLDPKVTGVLTVLLNRACRLLSYFIDDKEYVGVMKLHKDIGTEKLRKEMKKFEGKIIQLPPIKSRVKRQEREREVKKFKLLEYDKEKREVLFIALVEAGTYIRKLIHDLGIKIGGAHMIELRRTRAGNFKENNSHNMYEIIDAIKEYKSGNEERLRDIIIPGEIIGEVLPRIEVKEEYLKKLKNGSPVFKKFIKSKLSKKILSAEKITIFFEERFIEVAKVTNEGEIVARPEFVLN